MFPAHRLIAAAGSLVAITVPTATVQRTTAPPQTVVVQDGIAFGTMTPAARANVLKSLATARQPARRVVARVVPSIVFDADVDPCRSLGKSCSVPTRPDASRPWAIHLDKGTTADITPSQRFWVFHELGHAVWTLVLSQSDQQAFVDGVTRALAGKQCRGWRLGRPCAAITEMYADEFARWAGGFRVSMTGYETPSFFTAPQFGALITAALTGRTSARA
jgi:hypothetical protein